MKLAILTLLIPLHASATVLLGDFSGVPDVVLRWGGGGDASLYTGWSRAEPDAIWLYGSDYNGPASDLEHYWTGVDVFDAGFIDPLSVPNAHRFDYSDRTLKIEIGHTVFFRGVDGFFGAWVLHALSPDPYYPQLDATWYFQDRGNGNFRARDGMHRSLRAVLVPEPETVALISFGLLALALNRAAIRGRGRYTSAARARE